MGFSSKLIEGEYARATDVVFTIVLLFYGSYLLIYNHSIMTYLVFIGAMISAIFAYYDFSRKIQKKIMAVIYSRKAIIQKR